MKTIVATPATIAAITEALDEHARVSNPADRRFTWCRCGESFKTTQAHRRHSAIVIHSAAVPGISRELATAVTTGDAT